MGHWYTYYYIPQKLINIMSEVWIICNGGWNGIIWDGADISKEEYPGYWYITKNIIPRQNH